MEEIGGPERAFQFAYRPDNHQDFGAFLAANAELFPAFANTAWLSRIPGLPARIDLYHGLDLHQRLAWPDNRRRRTS